MEGGGVKDFLNNIKTTAILVRGAFFSLSSLMSKQTYTWPFFSTPLTRTNPQFCDKNREYTDDIETESFDGSWLVEVFLGTITRNVFFKRSLKNKIIFVRALL